MSLLYNGLPVALKIGIIILMLFLFRDDVKFRHISLWQLVLALLLVVSLGLLSIAWQTLLTYAAINISIIGFQLVVVWAYFSIKNKRVIALTSHYLGLGDILIMIVYCFCLWPPYFVLFLIVSCLISIISFTIYQQLHKEAVQTIPFAGIMALIYAGCLVCSLVFNSCSFL